MHIMSLEKVTLVSSDIVDSTGIKKRHALGDITHTFTAYHRLLDNLIGYWSGKVWTKSGDGIDFFFLGQNAELNSFACASAILDNLRTFNLCGKGGRP
jgi:class 3 adenylate cyclase